MLEAREAILQKRLETFATNPRHSEWKVQVHALQRHHHDEFRPQVRQPRRLHVELIASGYDYSEDPPAPYPHNLAEVTPDPLLVTVPPGGSEYYVDVAVAVAGAAATPVKILLAREDFDLQEVDEEEED